MKKFIITGATGHLGNTLTRALSKEKDCQIKLLLLEGETLENFDFQNLEIAYGNILDKDFLSREITEGSVVFHLAGIVDITSSNKNILYDVNVNGTKNIADVCLEKKVKKLIYTSSVHIIEPIKKQKLLLEPVNFDENKIVGDYAKSKIMATKYIFDKVKEGLNAVVVYPSGIIGVNDYKISNIGQLLLDIINNEIKAKVNGGYNFVDVRDVANGIIGAYKSGRVGEGYILSGNTVTIDELFETVNTKLGRKNKQPRIAMWFVKMFSKLAEAYYKVRGKKPLFTAYSLYTLTSNHNFSYEKAQRELGYSVRPATETLCDAIDWLYENKSDLIAPMVKAIKVKKQTKKRKEIKLAKAKI